MVNLIVDAIEPGGRSVADVTQTTVDVSYDRLVRHADGSGFVLPTLPSHDNVYGWMIYQITPNDDPTIHPHDQGFLTVIDIEWIDNKGYPRRQTIKVAIPSSAVDSTGQVALSTCDFTPTPAPYFVPGSQVSGIAVWADPITGEQIPYLTAPATGTLTTIGA